MATGSPIALAMFQEKHLTWPEAVPAIPSSINRQPQSWSDRFTPLPVAERRISLERLVIMVLTPRGWRTLDRIFGVGADFRVYASTSPIQAGFRIS